MSCTSVSPILCAVLDFGLHIPESVTSTSFSADVWRLHHFKKKLISNGARQRLKSRHQKRPGFCVVTSSAGLELPVALTTNADIFLSENAVRSKCFTLSDDNDDFEVVMVKDVCHDFKVMMVKDGCHDFDVSMRRVNTTTSCARPQRNEWTFIFKEARPGYASSSNILPQRLSKSSGGGIGLTTDWQAQAPGILPAHFPECTMCWVLGRQRMAFLICDEKGW